MEIKSIREFLSWVDQKVFFLDENEGSVCLKNGEKAEDSLIEPYTMKLLISDIKKHSYLWEKHENHAYTLFIWIFATLSILTEWKTRIFPIFI